MRKVYMWSTAINYFDCDLPQRVLSCVSILVSLQFLYIALQITIQSYLNQKDIYIKINKRL